MITPGRHSTRIAARAQARRLVDPTLSVACPSCGAPVGAPCVKRCTRHTGRSGDTTGAPTAPHEARRRLAPRPAPPTGQTMAELCDDDSIPF